MKIKITAGGIYGDGKELAIGTQLNVKEEPKAWAGRYEVISGGSEGKTPATGDKASKGDKGKKPEFSAVERDGAWQIVNADGEAQGAAVSADDAKAFNDLSDDDKATFAAEHAKA